MGKLYRYVICHYGNTNLGSSGSPILSLKSFKVIGVHHAALKTNNFNLGTFIKYPIYEFNNIFNYFPVEINEKKSGSENKIQSYKKYNSNNINIYQKYIEDGIYNIIPCNCKNMAIDINGGENNNYVNLQI